MAESQRRPRESEPRLPFDEWSRAYQVTNYATALAVLRDRSLSRETRHAKPDNPLHLYGKDELPRRFMIPRNMFFADPPRHTRLRGLVAKAFSAKMVQAWRPKFEAIAASLLSAVRDRSSFDLVESFAGPFPTICIAEMFGIESSEHQQFKSWSDACAQLFNPELSAEQQTALGLQLEEFQGYLQRAVTQCRRGCARDGLILRLSEVGSGQDRLTDEEIVSTCLILIAAGNLTTTDLIGNGVKTLLEHPKQLLRLRAEPSLIDNAIEEILRFDPPSSSTARIAVNDMQVAGCPIAAGDVLDVSIFDVNRDPRLHTRPCQFDVSRESPAHLSFGGGLHFCLGAPLARLEGRIGISKLLANFPELQLDPEHPPVARRVPFFRGWSSIPVLSGATAKQAD